jgi:hypothetical protein
MKKIEGGWIWKLILIFKLIQVIIKKTWTKVKGKQIEWLLWKIRETGMKIKKDREKKRKWKGQRYKTRGLLPTCVV